MKIERKYAAKENVVREKSFQFAVRIIKLYKYLNTKNEYVLSKQILRSGTSVGANIREADNGESKSDFIHKMGIAQKEIDETMYWLELLLETDYISKQEFDSIYNEAEELIKIIKKIIVTSKKSLIVTH